MKELKIGDRVVAICDDTTHSSSNRYYKGSKGIIIGMSNNDIAMVKWDINSRGKRNLSNFADSFLKKLKIDDKYEHKLNFNKKLSKIIKR